MMTDLLSTTGATLAAPQRPTPTPKDKATAQDFESVFLGQVFKTMLETAQPESDEFTGGQGEEMFRGVLAEKLGTEMAKRGGIGLAPIVLDQMMKMQEQNR
jgi:Rod binding domain-containing protein